SAPRRHVRVTMDLAGTTRVRDALALADALLADAGVPSPRVDAELLCAHAAGADRSAVTTASLLGRTLADLGPDVADAFARLVAARAERRPLQHLTGRAPFRHLELEVGPGVFVPRPETEDV